MITERIKILQGAGLISETSAGFAENTACILMDRFQDRSESVEGFITHLAMAVQRILNNEMVDQVDDAIWEEVKNSDQCKDATDLLNQILKGAPCEIPENESRFLIIHLCNIVNS